ncbi:hypothetical protein SNEBB_007320 [Seison nebaliae]|nr:hypothetical protein SNEBB_007320 [Seison nebaliae]
MKFFVIAFLITITLATVFLKSADGFMAGDEANVFLNFRKKRWFTETPQEELAEVEKKLEKNREKAFSTYEKFCEKKETGERACPMLDPQCVVPRV